KKMKWVSWGLQGVLAAAFLFAGGTKLLGNPIATGNFELWGFPVWFCYVIGAVEVLGAIGLWTRFSRAACALLGAVMIGAVITLVVHNDAPKAVAPIIVFALLGALFWVKTQLCKSTHESSGREKHAA